MSFLHRIHGAAHHPRAQLLALMGGAQGLNGLSELLVFRWLDPISMGYWSAAQMAALPLEALKLGILSGLARHYPYLIGSGEPARAHRLVEAALAHSLFMCGLGLLAAGGFALVAPESGPARYAVITVALVWALGYYAQFVRSTLRSSASFVRLGCIELGLAVLGVFTLSFVFFLGFQGLLLRALLLAALASAIFFTFRSVRARPAADWGAIREMFQFGRHTYVTGYILLIGKQAERTMLLAFAGGIEAVGYYSPVLGVWSLLQVVPSLLHASSYPQFLENYGKDHDVRRLLKGLLGQIRKTAFAMLLMSTMVGVAGWSVVTFALPTYSAAALPICIVCLAGPFLPMRMLATYYLARKSWPKYYLFTALEAILPYVFIPGFLGVMSPLDAVATGVASATALSSVFLLIATIRHAAASPGSLSDSRGVS